MRINEFEDRQNDWLAQEMAREGYVNNTSGLQKDHERHERSRNWDAGAISNAKEHEERHNLFQYNLPKEYVGKKKKGEVASFSAVMIFIIYFLIIMFAVFR